MPELVESLTASLMFGHDPLVVAAMAHLNLVMIHPFRDGNGRMARALQTLVLAKSGIGNPEFSSIEEWLGANTEDYYRALAHAGGGSWQPERSTSLWLKFNLRAHHIQSQTVERRIKRSELLWEKLDDMISTKKLPERVFDALYDAVDGFRIRRSTYMAQSKTDERTASRDLKRLVDTEVLEARGEKRGRIYVAGPMLIAMRQGVVTDLKYTIAEPYKGFAALLAGDVT